MTASAAGRTMAPMYPTQPPRPDRHATGDDWEIMAILRSDRFTSQPVRAGVLCEADADIGASGELRLRQAGGTQTYPSPVISYSDPITGNVVHRMTRDGADSQVVNQITPSPVAWSPNSRYLSLVKWGGTGDTVNGIYVLDTLVNRIAPVCAADSQWASPVISVDGSTIYFLDGWAGTPDGFGNKPWKIRSVSIPSTLAYGATTPPTATITTVLDIGALATAAGVVITDMDYLVRNHHPTFKLLSCQVYDGNGWRTLVLEPNGSVYSGWGIADQGWHASDGTRSLWSINSTQWNYCYTVRATSTSNHTPIRAVWDVTGPTALFTPTTPSPGNIQVAYSDWIFNVNSGTDIFLSAFAVPSTWHNDVETLYPAKGRLHGEIYPMMDLLSVNTTPIDGVRVAATEYAPGSGSDGHLYLFTLGDWDIGASTPSITGWADIRANRKWAGHRNRLDDGTTSRYKPWPVFSPDGTRLVWTSTSENTIAGTSATYSYPSGTCGPAGGASAGVAFTDLYLTTVDGTAEGAGTGISNVATIDGYRSNVLLGYTSIPNTDMLVYVEGRRTSGPGTGGVRLISVAGSIVSAPPTALLDGNATGIPAGGSAVVIPQLSSSQILFWSDMKLPGGVTTASTQADWIQGQDSTSTNDDGEPSHGFIFTTAHQTPTSLSRTWAFQRDTRALNNGSCLSMRLFNSGPTTGYYENAVRMFRRFDKNGAALPTEAYYSAWWRLPVEVSYDNTGTAVNTTGTQFGFWNNWQMKDRIDGGATSAPTTDIGFEKRVGIDTVFAISGGTRASGSLVALPRVGARKPIPINQWFFVEVRYRSSTGTDGIVQVWQDGELILDYVGPTRRSASVRWETSWNNYGGLLTPSNPEVLLADVAITTVPLTPRIF